MKRWKSSLCALASVIHTVSLMTFFSCSNPSKPEVEPQAPLTVAYGSFSDFSIERGTDADSSFVSFRGVHDSLGNLQLEATSWGIVEYGLFLKQIYKPQGIIFAFMAHTETVTTRTWGKVTFYNQLSATEHDTLHRLAFTNLRDTLEIQKISSSTMVAG